MRLSDSEWQVMNVVWIRGLPTSVRDVLEELETETSWAYSTVRTMMNRLVKKGALRARLRANTTLYEAALTRAEAQRTVLSSIVEKAFDGAFGPMMYFVLNNERLSDTEKEQLRKLLKQDSQTEEGDDD